MAAELISGAWLYEPGRPPLVDGAVVIEDGVIRAQGKRRDLLRTFTGSERVFPAAVLMPGFVNAHTHLELTHTPRWRTRFAGQPQSAESFVEWILHGISLSQTISDDERVASFREGLQQSLCSGTTTVGDILTTLALGAVYEESSLLVRAFCEVLGRTPERVAARLEQIQLYCQNRRDIAGLSPHAPYTLHVDILPLIVSALQSLSGPYAVHLAETGEELRLLLDGAGDFAERLYPAVGWQGAPMASGGSPLGFLQEGGLVGPQLLAIHGVHLVEHEIKTLAQVGATICLCPRSNAFLDVGVAPVALMRAAGVKLCIGTDSLASNTSLSLWDELRYARHVYGAAVDDETLFSWATTGGATALGFEGYVGGLRPGMRADIQVVDCPGMAVWSATRLLQEACLHAVFCGGSLLYSSSP